MQSPLVTTSWLAENLSDPSLLLFDASMETVIGKEPLIYDSLQVIPGAQKLSLEAELFDRHSKQLHAMPTASQFSQFARRAGVSADRRVVIYDNQGIYSAPRAWWTFKLMGVEQVMVLDGGLPAWIAEGRQTVSEYASTSGVPGDFRAKPDSQLVCDASTVLAACTEHSVAIIDARGAARFTGQAPEPRPGVRGGHIPGSANLPFADVLAGDGLHMKTAKELQTLLSEVVSRTCVIPGSSESRLIFSCGSGITACILLLAASHAGLGNLTLYDGSWAEWGSDPALPIA